MAKAARPPQRDDPAQSERFIRDAAEMMVADGAQVFERAMETLARPTNLPAKTIIKPTTAAKKRTAKTIKKSGSHR